MREFPHTEDKSINKQTPKSLCRISIAKSMQISKAMQKNQNFNIVTSDFSDKISSDSIISDNSDDGLVKPDFQFSQQTNMNNSPSPHLLSLKRSQNYTSLENPGFLKQISHPLNGTSYSSLKRNNSVDTSQEMSYSQNVSNINEDNDQISNGDSCSDSFESDGLQNAQADRNDPIQTDDFFFSQENNYNKSDNSTDQVETDEADDKIENEMNKEIINELNNEDTIEEASQDFSDNNNDNHPFLPSDYISENDSDDDSFNALNEEIDSTVHSQFFKQQKVVFEFINDETYKLDKWNFEYMRIIYAKTVDSQIEELNEDNYRVVVRKCDTAHIKKQGDNFVIGVPYYIYAYMGKIYLIAPSVSDKL